MDWTASSSIKTVVGTRSMVEAIFKGTGQMCCWTEAEIMVMKDRMFYICAAFPSYKYSYFHRWLYVRAWKVQFQRCCLSCFVFWFRTLLFPSPCLPPDQRRCTYHWEREEGWVDWRLRKFHQVIATMLIFVPTSHGSGLEMYVYSPYGSWPSRSDNWGFRRPVFG